MASKPSGVEPILLLDSYRCHLMASVVTPVETLGIKVEHIPGGCTGLVQPVDVGVGKPLKNRVQRLYNDWMIEQGPETIKFKPPHRSQLAAWIIQSLKEIDTKTVFNSWRKTGLSYFS